MLAFAEFKCRIYNNKTHNIMLIRYIHTETATVIKTYLHTLGSGKYLQFSV